MIGGPGRTRTYDQGIHSALIFPSGVDYLITLNMTCLGAGRSCLLLRTLWHLIVSPQVVSAPSESVLPAWLRIAISPLNRGC